jgi:ppGpp synthetase/RelA/SpoT-type nucleotidyltranferase
VVRVTRKAQLFLKSYHEKTGAFSRAATELETIIRELVRPADVPIHGVMARAKTPLSLRGKLRRKRYDNPAVQVTDLVAARVITYFRRDIDRIERELHVALEVSEKKSRDARSALAEDQFGYRSVHLIARLRPQSVRPRSDLGRRWFEVQIRSILDHAWSEIEHEAVYKSGVDFTPVTRRRFKAIAASLEVLEDAFAALDAERNVLIAEYMSEYASGAARDRTFDVARLQAFLEVTHSNGESWRSATAAGRPFPHGSAAAAVELLESANLSSPSRLEMAFASRPFRDAAFRFAATEGVAMDSISHLGLIVVAVAATRPTLLMEQFPEMVFSPGVIAAIGA